jgi:hypothetical protein
VLIRPTRSAVVGAIAGALLSTPLLAYGTAQAAPSSPGARSGSSSHGHSHSSTHGHATAQHGRAQVVETARASLDAPRFMKNLMTKPKRNARSFGLFLRGKTKAQRKALVNEALNNLQASDIQPVSLGTAHIYMVPMGRQVGTYTSYGATHQADHIRLITDADGALVQARPIVDPARADAVRNQPPAYQDQAPPSYTP